MIVIVCVAMLECRNDWRRDESSVS